MREVDLKKNQHAAIQCNTLYQFEYGYWYDYVLQQTIRQNLTFFHKCRCYLLLFTFNTLHEFTKT